MEDSSLSEYLVRNSPPKVYYIPNFINEEQEENLIRRVLTSPRPKWEILSNRRLQNWGGMLSKSGLIPDDDIPPWLQYYMNEICKLPSNVFPDTNFPNHVLVNEYLAGQGIMPHLDGPLYYPTVTTITLGSHALLNFYNSVPEENNETQTPLNERKIGSLLLERRSLVIIQEDMYNKYLHGIDENIEDLIGDNVFNIEICSAKVGDLLKRDTRISLTIRNIPKVAKIGVKSLLMKR